MTSELRDRRRSGRSPLQRVDGVLQPMGTRKIAEHLNAHGYNLRGRRFHNSNVDGILTREHYLGSYLDRTADDDGVAPSDDKAIVVACPAVIEPEVAARVAARRAAAAPRVTAPRITSSPVLLTGLAKCGTADCDAGLVIRTGKGGRTAIIRATPRRRREPAVVSADRFARRRSTESCSIRSSTACSSRNG